MPAILSPAKIMIVRYNDGSADKVLDSQLLLPLPPSAILCGMKTSKVVRVQKVDRVLRVAAVAIAVACLGTLAFAQTAPSLTGNWAVKNARGDGTFSKVYFNLKQDGDKIRGT